MTAKWPHLYFARHGETSWNRERRYQGAQDIPLNETGQAQADAIGPLLVHMLRADNLDPTDLDWFCSPLSRARETMTRMRKAFDVELPPVVYDDRLAEISFGIMEGKLHTDIVPDACVPVGKRDADYWEFRPPEGENYLDLTQRLDAFSAQLTRPTIIVAHGGVLRAVRHMLGDATRHEVLNWLAPQGAIARFVDGRMKMHFADAERQEPVKENSENVSQ